MINVIFLGFGNVNQHLCKALLKSSEVSVIQIFNRSKISTIDFIDNTKFTSHLSKIEDADVYIIGIADDAINGFSESLPFKNKLVVHTSGSVSIEALSKNNRRGVFYPLQTFSKLKEIKIDTIPICIEAENSEDLNLLRKLGNEISNNVVEISSEKREKLHLAAVFVNNFTNYLYEVGSEILGKEDLSFNLLKPLIKETAEKIATLTPKDAQTGPAKRNDLKTIEKHLHLLENTEYREIYRLLTDGIARDMKDD